MLLDELSAVRVESAEDLISGQISQFTVVALIDHIKAHYLKADLLDPPLDKLALAHSVDVELIEWVVLQNLVLVVWVEAIVDLQMPQGSLPLVSYPFGVGVSHLLDPLMILLVLLLSRS